MGNVDSGKIKYLDKGFVKLINVSMTDQDVVDAARLSYAGESYQDPSRNQGLINYLMEHKHSSPFEMPHLAFQIKMPIFVMRQHVRHRTACLTGDTVVTFLDNKGNTSPRLKKTMGEIYDQWENGQIDGNPNAKSDRRCMKKRLRKQRVRVLNEETGLFEVGHIKNVYHNGIEPVYKVTLADGKQITMTLNHRIFTDSGWQELGEAVGWDEDSQAITKVSKIATNGKPVYQDYEWTAARVSAGMKGADIAEEAGCSLPTIRKWLSVHKLTTTAELPPDPNKPWQDYGWMAAQRKPGVGIQEIADAAGCSYHTVRKWLRIHDLSFTPLEAAQTFEVWNKGVSGYTINAVWTEEARLKQRELRSGENSNFWKGGLSTERELIGGWTQRQLSRLSPVCEVCGVNGTVEPLNCHHVVPVVVDISLAYDVNNLAAVCRDCHRSIHDTPKNEYDSAMQLRPELMVGRDPETFRTGQASYTLMAEYSEIVSVEYVGEEEVYDLEMEGPWHNFVANGMIVHNSLNEMSFRYSEAGSDYYLPDLSRFKGSHKSNKQGSGSLLPESARKQAQAIMMDIADREYDAYQELLSLGVSRETARGVLNVNYYTEVVWQMDLRNLFHYLKLRNDSHAQEEIQELAQIIEDFVKEHFPMCYNAFLEYDKGSVSFSRSEIEELKLLISSFDSDHSASEEGMETYLSQPLNGSVRRRKDFARKIGLINGEE